MYLQRNRNEGATSDADAASDINDRRAELYEAGKAMLTEFLRRTRSSRRKGGGSRGADSRKIDIVCCHTRIFSKSDAVRCR